MREGCLISTKYIYNGTFQHSLIRMLIIKLCRHHICKPYRLKGISLKQKPSSLANRRKDQAPSPVHFIQGSLRHSKSDTRKFKSPQQLRKRNSRRIKKVRVSVWSRREEGARLNCFLGHLPGTVRMESGSPAWYLPAHTSPGWGP